MGVLDTFHHLEFEFSSYLFVDLEIFNILGSSL